MSKKNYTGGQILTDVTPGLKKSRFSLGAMVFFLYCACAGGAFGIEPMISSSGLGLTLILLVVIPLFWALPIGLYCSKLTNLVPVDAGPYVWTRMAFGEFWGFSFGFWMALAAYLTGAAYVVLAVDYIGMYVPLTAGTAFALKAAFIIAKLSPNKGVPVIPILLLAAINLILVNINFEILVTILSPVLFIRYVGLAFAYVKLRKDYPVEKRGNLYYVKSKLAPVYICGGPLIVGVISFFVNGTEYFLLGFIAIIAAVIFYPVCKWIYGGLYRKDPENNPINPKTRLAQGDITRFGIFFLLFGFIALVGSLFLVWYEGSWGPAYYLEVYGSGIMSNFWGMIEIARWLGIIMLALGIVLLLAGKKFDPIVKED